MGELAQAIRPMVNIDQYRKAKECKFIAGNERSVRQQARSGMRVCLCFGSQSAIL
jgi:hypothetical protein